VKVDTGHKRHLFGNEAQRPGVSGVNPR